MLCTFFVGNDSNLNKISNLPNKNLHNFGLENRYECRDTNEVFFNYYLYYLSNLEIIQLAKCLNYALPPIKLNSGNYMTPFELFYRET